MSKINKVLEGFLRAVNKSEFRRNGRDVTDKSLQPKEEREKTGRVKSDAADTYGGNRDDLSEDRRPVERPDPYQVELDKMEQRIRQAKALTPNDMREIEQSLAKQDIQKDIYRSQMNMASDEAREKQKIKEESEARRTDDLEREQFKARINSNKNDRRRGR